VGVFAFWALMFTSKRWRPYFDAEVTLPPQKRP
jgi:hypothetical protein